MAGKGMKCGALSEPENHTILLWVMHDPSKALSRHRWLPLVTVMAWTNTRLWPHGVVTWKEAVCPKFHKSCLLNGYKRRHVLVISRCKLFNIWGKQDEPLEAVFSRETLTCRFLCKHSCSSVTALCCCTREYLIWHILCWKRRRNACQCFHDFLRHEEVS